MSKYLVSDLIFQFFHSYMKKSCLFFFFFFFFFFFLRCLLGWTNKSLRHLSHCNIVKKSLLIYLSSIKTKLPINFLKKKLLHLAEKRAGVEGVDSQMCVSYESYGTAFIIFVWVVTFVIIISIIVKYLVVSVKCWVIYAINHPIVPPHPPYNHFFTPMPGPTQR